MLSCNTNPIKCNFVRSYDDLVGKPSINGVTLEGNISFDDLGLSAWLEEETKNFLTTSELDEKLNGYIKTERNGSNSEGFSIVGMDGTSVAVMSYGNISFSYDDGFLNKGSDFSSEWVRFFNYNTWEDLHVDVYGIHMVSLGTYITLDAATLQALINLL